MKFFAIALSVFALSAHAALGDGHYAAQLQLNMSKPDVDGSTGGVDEEYSTSVGAGVRALWGLNDSGLSLRSGLALRQKEAKFDAGATDVTLEYLYLSVPVTLHYMLSSTTATKVGFFGGLGMDVLIDDDADVDGNNSDYDDGSSFVMPLIIGFDFMFNENWGLEASYEHGLTEVDDDVKLNSFVLGGYYQF